MGRKIEGMEEKRKRKTGERKDKDENEMMR